jgi:hypothetical protein
MMKGPTPFTSWARADSVDEARILIEKGFTYVCDVEDVKLFKKPKRSVR